MDTSPSQGPNVLKIILIVVGAVVVLAVVAIILAVTVFRDDIVKATVQTTVGYVRENATNRPPDELNDSLYVALCDDFLHQFDVAPLPIEQSGILLQTFGNALEDKKIESDEYRSLAELMVAAYPEQLEQYAVLAHGEYSLPDSSRMEDSMSVNEGTAE